MLMNHEDDDDSPRVCIDRKVYSQVCLRKVESGRKTQISLMKHRVDWSCNCSHQIIDYPSSIIYDRSRISVHSVFSFAFFTRFTFGFSLQPAFEHEFEFNDEHQTICDNVKRKWKESITCSRQKAQKKLFQFVPILRWLPEYINHDFRKNFPHDLIAGLTVGIMHIPQGFH